MKSNNLCTGINILSDMELNLYMMEKLYGDLTCRIENMRMPSPIKPPAKPQKPRPYVASYDFSDGGTTVMWIVGLLCGVMGMLGSCNSNKNYEDSIFGSIGRIEDSIGHGFLGLILWTIIGLVIGALLGAGYAYIKQKDRQDQYNAEYARDCEKYENDCIIYDNNYRNYLMRLNKQKLDTEFFYAKKQALIKQKDLISQQYRKTRNNLNGYYDLLRIDTKFRNIVPVGYMCEFINLGISNKLEGADGLYYLVLKELRYDQMQYTMNEISRKLDVLINNQRSIYSELCSMNNTANNILNSVNRLVDSCRDQNDLLQQLNQKSEINNYTQQRIAAELEYQSQMMIISDLLYK